MNSPAIENIAIAAVIFGVVLIAKSRSNAAANGTPVAQVNLIPEKWSDPLRPLAVRRILVVAWVLAIIGGNFLAWREWGGAPFILLSSWWIGLAISQATRQMAELNATQLDERMLAARNQAFRSAYYGIGSLVVLAAIVPALLGDGITLTRGLLIAGALSVIVLVAYLPSSLLAWTETTI